MPALVGYGRVGKRIASALEARGIPYVVAEQNREMVEDLRKKGVVAVSGNAADPAVLIQATSPMPPCGHAAMLVVATTDRPAARTMLHSAAPRPGQQ